MTIITLTQNHHLIIIAPTRATGLVVYYLLRTHCYSHRFVLGRPPEGTVRHWMEHEMDKFPPSVMDSLSGMNESSCPGGSASLFPVRAIVLRVANGIRLLVQPDRGETRHPVDEQGHRGGTHYPHRTQWATHSVMNPLCAVLLFF